jgi:hypothetical protein
MTAPRLLIPRDAPVKKSSRLRDACLSLVLAGFGSACVLGAGLPELRHDWRIPRGGADVTGPWLASFFDGWNPAGIGNAQPYPTFYLAGIALWPFHAFATTYALTCAIVFISLALAAASALAIARAHGGGSWAAAGLAAFATLNPWVYAKFVAGHIFMIAAYAVLLALVAETGRARPRTRVLVVLAAFSVLQIEFFAVAVVPLLAWSFATRRPRVAFAALLAASPIAFGLVASYAQVRATPFNVTWQIGQSLQPADAALLGGYEFGYARAFGMVWFASLAFACAAVAGLAGAWRSRRERTIVAISLAALVLATGTKGPIGPLYAWAVEHVAEIGLFRELYDLAGIVAIGYVVCLAHAGRAWRPAGVLLAACGLAFAIPWAVAPPLRFFVPERDVPAPAARGTPGERVAYLPAFQPMSLAGRGSGVDPDAYVRLGVASPLNEALPAWPVDSALAAAAFSGDDAALAGLGVTSVVARPYLASDYESLRFQWLYADGLRPLGQRSRTLAGRPLLDLLRGEPGVAAIANRPDGDAVFFGDLTPGAVHAFEPTRATIDPANAWVDARLAFAARPAWGTAFGGVTTSGAQPLALPVAGTGSSLLAAAEGRLVDDRGRAVTRGTGLHWWAIPDGARSVSCRGTCAVVLEGRLPPGLPEQREALAGAPLHVRFMRPWLGVADVPRAAGGTLRLNVRFDPAWTALANGRVLSHLRIEGAVNGWELPITPRGARVVFVETTAAAQCLLEAIAVLGLLAMLAGRFTFLMKG